jgi:hypothetical protein
MVADELVDRLDDEIGRRLLEQGRARRKRALAAIAEVRVLVTTDGDDAWEEVFDRPPTLGQLVARVGTTAFVVSVSTRARATRYSRGRGISIAAE